MIPLEWKLLSRLRLQFSDLNEHKLQRSTLRGTELETNEHFPLRCHCFSSQRSELFDNLCNVDPSRESCLSVIWINK